VAAQPGVLANGDVGDVDTFGAIHDLCPDDAGAIVPAERFGERQALASALEDAVEQACAKFGGEEAAEVRLDFDIDREATEFGRVVLVALARLAVAESAKSSSQRATSIGEYLALRSPLRRSSAQSLMREKSCGSSGLTLPKTRGAGESL